VVQVTRLWIFILIVLGLTGCDARRDLWMRAADDTRIFMTGVSCSANRAGSHDLLNQKFYQLTGTRWWLNDPCRGAVCNPLTATNPPDRFAYAITFVNEAGAAVTQKYWAVDRQDIIPLKMGAAMDVIGPTQLNGPPSSKSGDGCAGIVAVPWQRHGNRPFWVADATLQLHPADLQTASMWTVFTVLGLVLAFITGIAVAAAGYFDGTGNRKGAVTLCVLYSVVAVGVLLFLRSYMTEPIERLTQIQGYYAFYLQLPKSAGALLPMSVSDARRLFAGPPLTFGIEQSTSFFYWTALCLTVVFFALIIKRLVMGIYWIFVPLPLAVSFRRARARGDWPRASEIVEAVRRGTMNKGTWRARAMELKAARLRQELDAATNRLRSR
jgi:hypothetical protein